MRLYPVISEIPSRFRFPYHLISDSTLDWLLNVNQQVEVNFDKIEELARKGDQNGAAELIGEVMLGCMSCHNVAYKDYGKTPHIIEN